MFAATEMTEVCGIAPDGGGYIASAGTGRIRPASGKPVMEPDYVWDNHIHRIG